LLAYTPSCTEAPLVACPPKRLKESAKVLPPVSAAHWKRPSTAPVTPSLHWPPETLPATYEPAW
jgi:hypothetical protein